MNQSSVSHFVLLGFSGQPDRELLVGFLFLLVYLVTIMGNAAIILLIHFEPKLQTPMYFFLVNLSFIDICFSSTTVPKLVANIFSTRTISLRSCITQMYFFFFVGNTESLLMAVMALDRYVAICRPLHYTLIMNHKVCLLLLASCWIVSSFHSLLYCVMTSRLSFCGTNLIHHFFCDIPPILHITCSDTSMYKLVLYMEGALLVGSTFLSILTSYTFILKALLSVSSYGHRWKMFSTCSSHVVVVSLFYGTDLFTYMGLALKHGSSYNQIVSSIYSAITPMLNPFIYSLRNSDVKAAFHRAFRRHNHQNNPLCSVN